MSIRIALAGNPNCGKTTMFNALTGANQYVGNWPGVTVEKKEGRLKTSKGDEEIIITDLPGIYSLSPYTLEEVVSRDYLLKERPEAVINLVDATNIERNLYLTSQLLELGIPVVIALNMSDLLAKKGDRIDTERLSALFGCQVVETSALNGTGLKEVTDQAVAAAREQKWKAPGRVFPARVESAILKAEEALGDRVEPSLRRWYAIKFLERDPKVEADLKLSASAMASIRTEAKSLERDMDDDMESIITDARYGYIGEVIGEAVKKAPAKLSTSDKIDRIVTNRILGLPIFAAVMYFVYYISVTTLGTMGTDWANDSFVVAIQEAAAGALSSLGAGSMVTGLVVDGILGGLGAVFGFLPQMAILFLLLSILEDCGYMVRIAFVMDRVFRHFGLSGKSFIPLLISSGCGIPGIMASRTIENERDRRMTIMTTTFIPCGAKLPFIAMIAGAIFGGAWWVAPSAYFIGIAAIIISGIMLKKTKPFAGDPAPFVMELPAYHLPTVGNVLRSMWERGWSFIKKAGTIILLSTILIWFVTYFGFIDGTFTMLSEDQIDNSILAIIGNGISWLFAPLGWGNWQAAVASITGLVAKENIVGTLGILYGGSGSVYANIAASFTAISGFSFMVFNLLCAPCFAAMGAIKREMNNAKWTAFAIAYQCVFAYAIALVIFQLGSLFTGNGNIIGSIVAFLIVAFILFMLFRPYKKSNILKKKVKV